VLLVLHEDTLGGASRAVLRPVDVLLQRGWQVSIWCSRPSALYDDLAARGYDVDGAPRLMRYRPSSLRHPPGARVRLASFPRALAAFRRSLREQRPDVVHVNGRLALAEALVARAAGFPVVTFILDDALPGIRGPLARVLPWIAGREVLAASQGHAQGLTLGRRHPRVVYASARIAAGERAAHPSAGPLVVGTIGVVHPRKGTDLFIDMARQLRGQGLELDLRIAGPLEEGHLLGWGRDQLLRAEAEGLKWLGRVDVEQELPRWDLMVLPSRADPFPLAVLEAMELGVAVIGTSVDGVPEQLADGAGLLVPPGDAAALARAVRELATDPERRAAIAARGQRRVREHFTVERSADALSAAWTAAIDRS
jgi:glycosyltransferase involved in cell wall biosynthesis